VAAAVPPPSVDRSLGGRLDTSEPYPPGFWASTSAQDYWKKLQAFIAYVDGVLPPGFTMQNNAQGAYRSKPIPGTDAKGNPIDTGSHMNVPAHDFVIRSTVPGAKMPTAAYEKLGRVAQNFGLAADGSAHGTAAHLHVNAGNTGYSYIGDKKELHNQTGLFMKAINAPPTPQYPSNTIDQGDPSGTIFLDNVDKAFGTDAVEEARAIALGNPNRNPKHRSPTQDMEDTAQIVWHNYLANSGTSSAGVDNEFVFKTLHERLTGLYGPLNKELDPVTQQLRSEESPIVFAGRAQEPLPEEEGPA
jgi:hypothetical protein